MGGRAWEGEHGRARLLPSRVRPEHVPEFLQPYLACAGSRATWAGWPRQRQADAGRRACRASRAPIRSVHPRPRPGSIGKVSPAAKSREWHVTMLPARIGIEKVMTFVVRAESRRLVPQWPWERILAWAWAWAPLQVLMVPKCPPTDWWHDPTGFPPVLQAAWLVPVSGA